MVTCAPIISRSVYRRWNPVPADFFTLRFPSPKRRLRLSSYCNRLCPNPHSPLPVKIRRPIFQLLDVLSRFFLLSSADHRWQKVNCDRTMHTDASIAPSNLNERAFTLWAYIVNRTKTSIICIDKDNYIVRRFGKVVAGRQPTNFDAALGE